MRRPTNQIARRRTLFFLALPFALACGNDAISPNNGSVAGTWNLKTVNGSFLPFTIVQLGSTKTELTSDAYTLTASNSTSGSFTTTSTLRLTQNGQVTTQTSSDAGTYTVNGTSVTLVSHTAGGSTVTGSWSGNTITATVTGFAFIFARQ
jgi:hypothetical protein